MVQTTASLPASDRLFSFQSYSGIINSVQNAMYDGSFNFQGSPIFNNSSAVLWQSTSGTNYYNFGKLITADSTGGQAMSFNGNSSYIQIQSSPNALNAIDYNGSVGLIATNQLRLFAIRAYRSTWNTTAAECIAYWRTGYIMINQTPGFISYFQYSSGTLYEAKIALTNLTAGWHNFVWGYDGTNVYLNVDNGAFTAQAAASNLAANVTLLTNASAYSYFGCFANNSGSNGTDKQMYFFTGVIKDFASWNSLSASYFSPLPNLNTIASYYANGEAYANQNSSGSGSNLNIHGLDYHFTFDNDTASACLDLVQGIYAYPKNVTLLTGSANTSGWYNSRALILPFVNPGAGGVGFQGNNNLLPMQINFSTSYQWYLGMSIYGGSLGGTGTVTISVTDGTHTFSTNLSLAQLNVASWQQFYWNFIPSQYGLSGNCYVQVKVTGTGSGTLYFDHINMSPGLQSPYFDLIYQDPTVRGVYYNATTNMYQGTQYTYAYIKNWSDVGTIPKYSQEIGTLGSTIALQLNRDPNVHMTDTDIQLNNRVLIQCADPTNPAGYNYFDGYIADRTFDFNQNYITLILASWGQQAQNFMLLAGSAPSVQNKFSDQIYTPSSGAGGGVGANIGTILAVKTAPGQTTISELDLFFQTNQAGVADTLTVAMYSSLSAAAGSNGAYTNINNNLSAALAWTTLQVTYAAQLQQFSFIFNSPISVSPNTIYYFYIYSSLSFSSGSVGMIGSQTQLDPNSSTYALTAQNLANTATLQTAVTLKYNLVGSNNSSTVLYSNQDPSTILKNAINNLRNQGANFNYTTASIDTVGQKTTYQFQSATGADVLNTLPTLCPPGWFTYIDMTSNTIHLHAYSSRTVHKLMLGAHIQQLTIEQRMDTMVNTIYFTGGADPTNPPYNIFRFYQNAGSVAVYGVRMKVVTDNRVTSGTTADIVAQSYLNVSPEIRTVIMITDKAFNIDSITIGDLVNFGNFINGKTENWDQVNFDTAGYLPQGKWDYDITSPETLYLYIERVDNNVDNLQLTLSTTPPDVNKKVQQTLNSLLKQYTLNNPVTPTTGVNLIT